MDDVVAPTALAAEYHPAAGAIFNQHRWNLLWLGIAKIASGLLIWRGNMRAIRVTGMISGLADLGYLLFVEFPGYVTFFPGTAMTLHLRHSDPAEFVGLGYRP